MLLLISILIGCTSSGSEEPVLNEYHLKPLFENKGCTVYYFYHNGGRYYTDCRGDTISKEGKHQLDVIPTIK